MKFSDLNTGNLETTMRRIEIRRAWEISWTEEDYPVIASVSMGFMEASQNLEDARYLNTAMKLNDHLRLHFRNRMVLNELDRREEEEWASVRARLGLTS